MIKYLTAEEKPCSRDLWEEAFPEESSSSDEYYFSEKLKSNRILAIVSGENPLRAESMIHLNPYLMQVGNRRWRVDYLVGVATRRDKRHQGYMRRLLIRMMEDMRQERAPFCFLMPADAAIYRPFGFTYIFDQPQWRLADSAVADLRRRPVQEVLETAAVWMNRWMDTRYQVHTVRDCAYVRQLIKELASEAGTLEALYDGGSLVGIQGIWGQEKRTQRLLYGEASYIEEDKPARPAIMARIITPEEFVKVIRLKDTTETEELVIPLFLEDPLIPDNQGAWSWHLTREMSWLEPAEEAAGCKPQTVEAAKTSAGTEDASAENGLRLTVTELTGWLFGYDIPEAARPWAEAVEPLEGVFIDETE
ncbi:MAG: GNAT family N-acetyltransferase [Eubacteriales bacterium]|nr:GNAT family N-acetyltransferase [Eubacteriales bacterium]